MMSASPLRNCHNEASELPALASEWVVLPEAILPTVFIKTALTLAKSAVMGVWVA